MSLSKALKRLSEGKKGVWTKVENNNELGPLKAAEKEFIQVQNALNDAADARNKTATEGCQYHLWYKKKDNEIQVALANKEPPQDYTTAGEDMLGRVTFTKNNVQDEYTWKRLVAYALPESDEGWENVLN